MLTKEKIKEILSKRIEEINSLQIPHFSLLSDIDKASKRIKKAIENNEKIVIVGDYDVDGVVSTTIMVDFFKKLNIDVNWIVPNRFKHGYGLSAKIVEQINQGLVITVDNGISAIEASILCKNKNLDLIITDHHTVGNIVPDCFAIINPKQKECNFAFSDIENTQTIDFLKKMVMR